MRKETTMRIVPTNCVMENASLAKVITNSTGQVLLKKGTKLTEALLKRIEDNKIYTIYIDDEYSDNEIEELIRPELKAKAVQTLKDTFQFIEKQHALMDKADLDLKKRLNQKSMEKYLKQIRSVSNQIIEEISINRQLMINLVDIKNLDNYTYEHSLNVAIISLIMGVELKMNHQELSHLFLGALLHDLGKSLLPKDLVTKETAYTPEEEKLMESHSQLGYDYIKEHYGFPISVKMAMLQHHERFDGKGYPKKIAGSNIHRHARIIALADCYDSMTSDNYQTRALSPNEALEYIMGACGSHFDHELATIFSRKVVPYPEGSIVKLSDERFGVILKVNINYPLRPVVRILEKNIAKEQMEIIDLLKNTNITILALQYTVPK